MTTKAKSDARREEWRDPEIRKKRTDGLRTAALKRYEDPEERRLASERMAKFYQNNPDAKFTPEHYRRIRANRPDAARGLSSSPEYSVWKAMCQRCHNPKTPQFKDYGGRGITVCDEWRGTGGFLRFYDHIGPRPDGHTVGRVDNDVGYQPGNVRWETRAEQMRNTRRSRNITINGETKTLSEWSRVIGISAPALSQRIAKGHVGDALLRPTKGKL